VAVFRVRSQKVGQYSIQGEKPRAVLVFRVRSKEMRHSNVTSTEMWQYSE
jgi:hypothetical protein